MCRESSLNSGSFTRKHNRPSPLHKCGTCLLHKSWEGQEVEGRRNCPRVSLGSCSLWVWVPAASLQRPLVSMSAATQVVGTWSRVAGLCGQAQGWASILLRLR